mmetsp:Transcript_13558/g.31887  ORF Transcript_13558/g.31887 Transcript_13558/m.31887 type:complete len:323 (-) Transcript_13558:70-1038(-)
MDFYGGLGTGAYSRADIWNEFAEAGVQPNYLDGGHLSSVRGPTTVPATQLPYGYSLRDGSRRYAPWPNEVAGPQQPPPTAAANYNYPQSDVGYDYDFIEEIYPDARIVEERMGEPSLVATRVVGEEWKWIRKPYIGIEKVLEVPQVIVKEISREVPAPEIVERIIEVPKIEYKESYRQAPAKYQTKVELVDVPQVLVEEHVRHVPTKEVQERLFEVPKVEFRECIEYEDRVEYREVLVDKIVEVPEVEYRIIPVEHWVPQTYVQEVDGSYSYQEVPMVQVQEVERHEYAPTLLPSEHFQRKASGWERGGGGVTSQYANYVPF